MSAPKQKASAAAPADDPKHFLKDDLAGLMAPPKHLANPNFVGLLALLQEHRAGGKFGPDNVGEGDDVSFTAGEFSGSGKVCAVGQHGATVQDKTKREHRVHWHEITGHKAGKGAGKEKATDGK